MTISIPFKTKAAPVNERPKPRLHKTLFDGHLKVFSLNGWYELFLDDEQILSGATEAQIENRIRSLSEPSQQTTTALNPKEEEIPSTTHSCPCCGKEVNDLRQKLLGTPNCGWCTPQLGKLYGCMEYGHKTAGVLVVTSNRKEFLQLKKAANQRR